MPTVTTTFLEMRSFEELRPKRSADDKFWIGEATTPQWPFNRFLYLTVGGAWAWNDKREWTDEQWRSYVESDRLRTFVAYHDASPAGYYELRRDDEAGVEIAYFGLLPAFIGRGFGGALLTNALEEAWKMAPIRVWVHTCTLDHPAALANYLARGMRIYKVELGDTAD
ncbi:MAG: GNAT family N-acetyltransferase [Verrucomicrobia bacterium]|nr:GNAT family N-acetyltransferase [Verrucomicrobiota bacterium]